MRLQNYLIESDITVSGRKIKVTKPTRSKDQKMVYVDVSIFDKAWKETDRQMYIGKGGKGSIKGRYERFGIFVLGGKEDIGDNIILDTEPTNSIEVSEIYVNENGKISFTNGRHRYAWLRDMGLKKIPVVMPNESVVNAKKYGYITK